MSNEITRRPQTVNPFVKPRDANVNAGAVEIESERAIAEAQGMMVLAKRFPRDEAAAFDRAMQACRRRELAEESMYSYNRGGQEVTGPSIRLAEELARCWGNIISGVYELSRGEGYSEMEAFAWDLESNVKHTQRFTVHHIRETKTGNRNLSDSRDVYEVTANQGARRKRAMILAVLPGALRDAAVEECGVTLKSPDQAEPHADRVKRMLAEFGKLGVQPKMIAAKFGHSTDTITADELVTLRAAYQSMRDGIVKASEYFATDMGTANPEMEKLSAEYCQLIKLAADADAVRAMVDNAIKDGISGRYKDDIIKASTARKLELVEASKSTQS